MSLNLKTETVVLCCYTIIRCTRIILNGRIPIVIRFCYHHKAVIITTRHKLDVIYLYKNLWNQLLMGVLETRGVSVFLSGALIKLTIDSSYR